MWKFVAELVWFQVYPNVSNLVSYAYGLTHLYITDYFI